jgi:hypothetical protein
MTRQKNLVGRGTRPEQPSHAHFRTPRGRQQVTDCFVALTALLLMSVILYFTFQYNGR